MNFKAPSLLWALVAAVAFWFLVIRKTAAAPALSQSQDLAGPTPISGAPVPDLGTALAGEQTSLLGSILTYLKGGSTAGGGSIVAAQPKPVRTAGTSATGGAASSSNPGLSQEQQQQQQQEWLQSQRTAGAAFTTAAKNAGVPGPLNLNASGGFNSAAFQSLQTQDLLGYLNSYASTLIDGGAYNGGGGAGLWDPGLQNTE